MSTDLVTMAPDADLRDALAVFEEHAIRRLPLVADGRLVGMVTVDDLFVDLAGRPDEARPPGHRPGAVRAPEPVAPAVPS